MSIANIFQITFEIVVMVLITIIYRWTIYFTHEMGHFIVGKCLGFHCKIMINKASVFMPRLSTNIKGNHKITVKQDLIFSMNGVFLAEIMNAIFIYLFYQYQYIYLLILIHIPILFIDMIPDGDSDGNWVLEEFAKILGLKNSTKSRIKNIPVTIYLILLLLSTFLTVRCYIQNYDNNRFIWYGLPILCVFYFTSYRYMYRYAKNMCKGK